MTDEAELIARLEALTAGLQQEVEASQRELEESQEQRAGAARRGELGRDWQSIQARMDRGQTTLAQVFSGADDSPEAQRLLGVSRANVAVLAEDLPPELQEEIDETATETALLGRGVLPPTPVDPIDPLDPPRA